MLQGQNQSNAAPELFALRYFEKATIEARDAMGSSDQEWTWTPIGDFKPEELEIYATGGNTTTRQTMQGQWDSGEYY